MRVVFTLFSTLSCHLANERRMGLAGNGSRRREGSDGALEERIRY